MKKLFGIFSLSILLFSTFASTFTYATEAEEEAKQILTETLDETMDEFENSHNAAEIEENNDTIGLEEIVNNNRNLYTDNPYIVYDEENGLITVYTGDFSYGITIQDKNLGAENVGDYGDYYKGGNNTPYGGGKDQSFGNNNAWGGTNDNQTTDSTKIKGYDIVNHVVTNSGARQGPCSGGYHVPSAGEWAELVKLYYNAKGMSSLLTSQNGNKAWAPLISATSPDSSLNFVNDMKLVFAGKIRVYDDVYEDLDSWGRYLTSSPYDNTTYNIWGISVSKSGVVNPSVQSQTNDGYSVRCFKNEYIRQPNTVTYNPNGGAFAGTVIYNPNGGAFAGMEVNENKEYTYNYNGDDLLPIYNIQIPDRKAVEGENYSGWMFAGWYTKDGKTNNDWGVEFDINNPQTNIAYAKWLPFNDLKVVMGDYDITIMDRNLGAESGANGTYGTVETDAIGYYYQRGNNYGFSSIEGNYPLYTGTNFVSNPNHSTNPWGPGNYYYNNKFIVRKNNPYYWDNEKNKNLWGGNETNGSDESKQGPCPQGYHVPSKQEWKAVYDFFTKQVANNQNFCSDFGNENGSCFASILKLPFAGELSKDDISRKRQGEMGTYWSSTPQYDDAHHRLYLTNYSIGPQGNNYATNGNSVRCFRNLNDNNKLSYKIDGEIVNEYNFKWWESITKEYKINSPELENAKFIGWYNERNNTKFEFGESEYIAQDTVLIPEYECNPGYTKSDDGKSCELVKLTFNANGGKFGNGSQKKELIITINPIEKLFRKISHTPNFTDDGEFLETAIAGSSYGTYGGRQFLFYTPEYREITKIEGAKSINLNIRYAGNSCGWSNGVTPKYIWTGEQYDYDSNNYSQAVLSIGSAPSTQGEILEISRIISGDSITIYKSAGCGDYGWYATIIGTGIYKDIYYDQSILNNFEEPKLTGYIFDGWYYDDGLYSKKLDITNISTGESLNLYAKWKSLAEKVEETTTKNVVYTNGTTVTVGDETTEEVLSGSSTLTLIAEEVKQEEVTKEEDKTTVKESEIKVTSDKKVEYEGGLEVYLEKTENVGMANETTGKVEGTIKFSAPIAVKIPITSEAEYVKVQVKHEGEEFGFKGLTLNPVNECNNGEAVNDKYYGEDVEVKENNGERYATIYTCSASTFVAYTESIKPYIPQPAAGGGRVIKHDVRNISEEHNSADLEKESENTKSTDVNNSSTTRSNETVEQKVKKVEGKALTRGEVAVMTNILLEVFPQLIEGNKGLDDVTKACSSYTDEKDFTKDEKKAITRLCKLSIMGIHADNNKPLEEFMVKKESTNNEFNIVVNRSIENYNEKDLATVKEALKKLEGDNEGVVFGTVYDVFMNIKSIFN